MASDDQRLGELIGTVNGLVARVEDMRAENAADHANVTARLDTIEQKLDLKAGADWVTGIDKDVDALKGERDERKGKLIVIAALLTIIVGPCIVGLLLLAAGVIA